jgi:hypothetical protein
MPRISLSDIEPLPDPKKEQDAIQLLILLDAPGSGLDGRRMLFTFMHGNNWTKAKLDKVVAYVVSEGWAEIDAGVLQITEAGRGKIGK